MGEGGQKFAFLALRNLWTLRIPYMHVQYHFLSVHASAVHDEHDGFCMMCVMIA